MSSRSCNVEGATHSNFADLDVGRGASESGEGGDGGHICAGFGDSNLSSELVGEDRERDARAVEDSVPYLYFFFCVPRKSRDSIPMADALNPLCAVCECWTSSHALNTYTSLRLLDTATTAKQDPPVPMPVVYVSQEQLTFSFFSIRTLRPTNWNMNYSFESSNDGYFTITDISKEVMINRMSHEA